jgi:hypothetical protein
MYYAKTGDQAYKEMAYRTYNWVTYFQGLPGAAHAPWGEYQWWFTDEFSDGPRRMMDAFWAVPEWAPDDETHLLGSMSVVTKITYGAGTVTYSTFDADSTDVLRLNFKLDSILVDGKPIARRADLSQEGYTYDDKEKILYIRHTGSRDVDIQGQGDQKPPSYITFDDPHLPAGTPLNGQYPSGVVDWGTGDWQIGTPLGKFGTFTLGLTDVKAQQAQFGFFAPTIFVGLDVYNDGDKDASITFRSPEIREITFTIKPKELRRLRTGWHDPSSRVSIAVANGEGLRFDNLAYLHR